MSELALQLIAANKKTKSTTLDLGNCDLTQVPEALGELIWLETLILSDKWDEYDFEKKRWKSKNSQNKGGANKIEFLPPTLPFLILLKKFIFSNTGVSDLRPIAGLANLQQLYCDSNQISDLKPIAGLANLQHLNCYSNQISDLKPIAGLANLQRLNCSSNQISDLKPIAGLANLQQLDCSSNQISNLKPIAGLANLQHLNCYSNQISDLKPIAGLANLQHLDCSTNQISDLKPIAGLANLQQLDCSYNQISDLKPIAGLIEKGIPVKWKDLFEHFEEETSTWQERQAICVKDCPLTMPPVEVVQQGNEAILRYLKEMQAVQPEDVRLLNEAKLIVIGQPRAGKTSLRYKLCDTERILPTPDLTTRGIDIEFQHFEFIDKTETRQQFKYHIWDFGGQQIYHATHRFFLTKRTIYIAVVDTDVNDKQNDLDYWLHMIDLLGDGSPVFLVQNQKSDRSIEISDNLRNRFRNIICAKDYELNLDRLRKEDNPKFDAQRLKAFENFKADIELEFSRQPQPAMTKQKNDARLELETRSKKEPLIEMLEYERICIANGVLDKTAQLDLLRTLHNLGICLWYEGMGFLERIVILQNRWATDAVFKVLDNEIVKKKKGHFQRSDLLEIWNDPEYAGRVDELVLLMQRFKLCYQIDNVDEFIAPQLLDKNPPDDFSRASVQQGGVRMVIDYEFMPRGIITQFIVAMHRQISGDQRHAWETGFAVRSIQGPKATGMAEESYDSRKLELWANGPGAGLLLQQMLSELEKIHESYNRLQYNKQIPCVCDRCSNPAATKIKEFDYEEILLEKYQNRQPGIRCSFGNQIVPFEKLLGELGFTNEQTKLDFQKSRRLTPDQEMLLGMLKGEIDLNLNPEKTTEVLILQPTLIDKMKKNLWIPILLAIFIIFVFLAWAKPGSELDFFGWFKVKQGTEEQKDLSKMQATQAVIQPITVVGSIKINNRNATAEEVKKVYIKGEALIAPSTLNGNSFRIRSVPIPDDKIIEISLDIKGLDISPSAMFKLPHPDKDNVANLGEVLLEVKWPRKSNSGKTSAPTIVINNTNMVEQK